MNNETVETVDTGGSPDVTPDAAPDTSGAPSETPVQVVSVDELVERLTSGSGEENETGLDDGPETVDGEEHSNLANEYFQSALDDTTTKEILAEIRSIKGEIETAVHPAMTTNFADYTVTESLLLLLFLSVFGSFIVRMVKSAFSWLAW